MTEPTAVDPSELDVAHLGDEYFLLFRDQPVLTTERRRVTHQTPGLLERMVEEFNLHSEIYIRDGVIEGPEFFGCYSLYCAQKDWIEQSAEPLSTDFAAELVRDDMLFRCPGPEVDDQMDRWEPVLEIMKEYKLILPGLVGPVLDDPELYADEEEYRQAMRRSTPNKEFVAGVVGNLPTHARPAAERRDLPAFSARRRRPISDRASAGPMQPRGIRRGRSGG